MNGGALAFTLGMEAGPLLRGARAGTNAIGAMIGAAARFTGIAAAMGAAFEGLKQSANIVGNVFEAFERGADLQRLHARTGESVADLFLLQRAFKAVGLQSEDVGSLLFHLQKGLSGISEMGEDTAGAFGILGLSMLNLRALNGPQQFQAIATAMTRLDRAQSATVAGRIFGREGAANFLQLARSGQMFTRALQDNAAAAAQMARNASAFNAIELSITRLKFEAQNLFAGIAEGAAPGLQKVLDMLNGMDLSAIGKKFGDMIAAFGQAIEDHKLGELLKLSLEAGTEGFKNSFIAMLDGMTAAMRKFFQNLAQNSNILKNFFGGQIDMITSAISAGASVAMGEKPGKITGLGAVFQGIGDAGAGTASAFASAFTDSLSKSSDPAAKAFMDLVKSLADKAKAGMTADDTWGPGTSAPTEKPFDFTNVEKMGFVFGGGGPTILQDHAKQTAVATQRTAVATERMVAIFGQLGGGLGNMGLLN